MRPASLSGRLRNIRWAATHKEYAFAHHQTAALLREIENARKPAFWKAEIFNRKHAFVFLFLGFMFGIAIVSLVLVVLIEVYR